MKRRRLLTGTCAGVAASVVLVAGPALAATWTVVPSQALTAQSGLGSLAMLSATDGWAAGFSLNGGLIERWNGTQWTAVASPDILDHRSTSNSAGLGGVAALSSSSAFAVGTSASYSFGDGLLHKLAVAERWNGSTWSQLTVPNPQVQNELAAVKAFSASDVWAIGRQGDSFGGTTLALHWNGSAFSPVTTPSPGTRDNVLSRVSATSASDLWAVGYSRDLPYGNRARHSLALHWNGQSWSLVHTPDVGTIQTFLRGVVAISPTNAWAVGYANGLSSTVAVVLHWDGQSWSVAPAPALASLDAITALSAGDLWASGTGTDGLPYLANWRGSAWTITAAPGGGLPSTFLTGLAPVGASTILAVGWTSDPTTGNARPVALRTASG